jgi:hypothetical protein
MTVFCPLCGGGAMRRLPEVISGLDMPCRCSKVVLDDQRGALITARKSREALACAGEKRTSSTSHRPEGRSSNCRVRNLCHDPTQVSVCQFGSRETFRAKRLVPMRSPLCLSTNAGIGEVGPALCWLRLRCRVAKAMMKGGVERGTRVFQRL